VSQQWGKSIFLRRLQACAPFLTTVASQLVFKRSNPADRRGVPVALSPKGRIVTNRIALLLREVNDLIYSGMSRKELEVIKKFIDKLSFLSALALKHVEANYWSRHDVAVAMSRQ
jgi:hypothetical protein